VTVEVGTAVLVAHTKTVGCGWHVTVGSTGGQVGSTAVGHAAGEYSQSCEKPDLIKKLERIKAITTDIAIRDKARWLAGRSAKERCFRISCVENFI